MPNPDKTFGWYMHQKTPYKFNTGKCQFFPLSFIPVILDRKSNIFIVHADDAVIADGNPMGILSKVVNHRPCVVKSFAAPGYFAVLRPAPSDELQSYGGDSAGTLPLEVQHQLLPAALLAPEY